MTTQVTRNNIIDDRTHPYSDYLIHDVPADRQDMETIMKRRVRPSNDVVINCGKSSDDVLREILLTAASYKKDAEVFLLYPISARHDRASVEKVCITPFMRVLSQLLHSHDDALTLWAYMRTYDTITAKPFKFSSGQNVMQVHASGSIVLKKDGNTYRMNVKDAATYSKLLEYLAKR